MPEGRTRPNKKGTPRPYSVPRESRFQIQVDRVELPRLQLTFNSQEMECKGEGGPKLRLVCEELADLHVYHPHNGIWPADVWTPTGIWELSAEEVCWLAIARGLTPHTRPPRTESTLRATPEA